MPQNKKIFFILEITKTKIICILHTFFHNFLFLSVACGKELKNEFLFCEPLQKTTKATDIMQKIQDFFDKNNLTWDIVGSICTDGAPAMMGATSGFTALVKQKAPHVITIHCVLHRYALGAKTLPENLRIVLQKVVEAVNFIRSRALNHCLFQAFCDEMGSEHSILLLHTEVRWLSSGLILNRVFELRTEVEMFLRDRNSKLCENFVDAKFIACLGYLSEIFTHLNPS